MERGRGKWDRRTWRVNTTITDLVGAVFSGATQLRGSLVSFGPEFGTVYRPMPPEVVGVFVAYNLAATSDFAGGSMKASTVAFHIDGNAWAAGMSLSGTWSDGGKWEAGQTWVGKDIPMS